MHSKNRLNVEEEKNPNSHQKAPPLERKYYFASLSHQVSKIVQCNIQPSKR